MLVRELIAALQDVDPNARVVVEYDAHFCDIKAVLPQVILTEGSSWADYPGEQALVQKNRHLDQADHVANMTTPREIAIAIWGTSP